MKKFDIIILGAGASGLMCAATAAIRDKRVALIDHANQPGKKILVSGGGKCNFSNRQVGFESYVGENTQFTRSALAGFTTADMLDMVNAYRIPFEEREEGQLFCKHSAQDFLDLLLKRCVPPQVTFFFGKAPDLPVVHTGEGYQVSLGNEQLCAASLVIATGNIAWPQIGATDLGLRIAKYFGHRIIAPRPALVGFTMGSDWQLAGLSGISHRVTLRHISKTAYSEKQKKSKRTDTDIVAQNLPLLFTHKGVSGPAILQASLYWRPGDIFLCDFFPGQNFTVILNTKENGKLYAKNLFKPFMPSRLAEALLPPHIQEKKVATLSQEEKEILTMCCKNFPIIPQGTEGAKKAEAAKGGVSTEEISSQTMESKRLPGLFFCGEVIDITGRLGGYNIHWALASGRLAGQYA